MKLCFSTLGCTDAFLEEILPLAASHNIHALEIRGLGGVMDNRKIEALSADRTEDTSALFSRYAVTPHVLGTSCTFHSIDKLEDALAEGKASIDIASRLHIPYIRVFGNKLVGENKEEITACYDRVAAGIARLCEYAVGTGVSVLLEVHGDYNRIETLGRVTEQLAGREEFGLIWDIAHTHAYGDQWDVFYRAFRPLIRHIHIKDRTEEGKLTLPGEGSLPILPIASCLLSDGYDGFFSLEWERKWHPELEALPVALSRFVSLMNSI